MFRSLRHLSASLRRRTIFVTLAVLLVVFSVAFSIATHSQTRLTSRRNASVIRLSNEAVGRNVVSGTGMNLTGLPVNNLVTNGSFSPSVFQAYYSVSAGGKSYFDIKVSETRTDISLTEGHFVNASFALFRESLTSMSELHKGVITSYEAGRVIDKMPVAMPEGLNRTVRFLDFAERGGTAYACGSSSALLRMTSGGEAEKLSFDFLSDLTAIAAGPDGLMAGDSTGRLFASADGQFWQLLSRGMEGAVSAISYIPIPDDANGFFLASGGPGELMFGHLTDMSPLSTPVAEDAITSFVMTADGIVYALGDQGHVFLSTNGVEWKEEKELASDTAWLAGTASGNVAFFTGARGRMAIRRQSGVFEHLGAGSERNSLYDALRKIARELPDDGTGRVRPDIPDLSDVLAMTSDKIVVLTGQGKTLYSGDQGKTWTTDGPFSDDLVTRMALMPSGDIYLAHPDGSISRTELTSRFTFEPALPDGNVRVNDLIALSLRTGYRQDAENQIISAREGELRKGEWCVSGGASAATADDRDSSRSGYDSNGALRVTFETPDTRSAGDPSSDGGQNALSEDDILLQHERLFSIARKTVFQKPVNNPNRPYLSARLSQHLDLEKLVSDETLPLFRLEFDVLNADASENSLEVWFSGPRIDEGKVFRVQKDGWQHQRVTIGFTQKLSPDDELWINFGFSGSGTFILDNVWFGRADDAQGALSSMAAENETLPSSDVVRLDCVPIGRAGYASESWCLPEGLVSGSRGADGHNLGSAMQFVERLGASPWLVIDIHATSDELLHLIEYIAGSPLSPYGKLRSRDGALGKWSDRFDAIYIEITDRGNILQNDVTRSNSVLRMISRIRASSDFTDMKNRVFFIDGMQYDDGRTHTSTDFHAGDLKVRQPFEDMENRDAVLEEWVNTIPRRRSGGDHLMPELIRSFDAGAWEEAPRMADTASALLGDLGAHSAIALVDLDLSSEEALSGRSIQMHTLKALQGLSGMARLNTPTVIRSGDDKKQADQNAKKTDGTIYDVFRSRDEVVFVAANPGKTTRVLTVEGFDYRSDVRYTLFDHRGYIISDGMRSPARDAFTLLPGGVMVIRQKQN